MTNPTSDILGESWRKFWILFCSLIGLIFISIELTCYIIIFQHISVHNNTVMSEILDQNIIKKRNQVNAISLTGLFTCWSMLFFHLIVAGFFSYISGNKWNREMSTILRYFEYVLVPYIQIRTSPPIKRYLSNHTN